MSGAPIVAATTQAAATQWANYQEYNKTLRTWFVTFGIGAPALFLTNPAIGTTLKSNGAPLSWIVGSFVLGCAIQVIVTLLNKMIAWYCYNFHSTGVSSVGHYLLGKLEDAYVIDVIVDICTAALFGYAIYLTFMSLIS